MLTDSWKLSLFWPNLVFKLLPFDFLQSIKILCPTTMQGRRYKWLSLRRTTSKWQVYHHYVVLNSNRIWLWLMWVEKNKKLGISQSQQEGWRTRLSVSYLEKNNSPRHTQNWSAKETCFHTELWVLQLALQAPVLWEWPLPYRLMTFCFFGSRGLQFHPWGRYLWLAKLLSPEAKKDGKASLWHFQFP